jgi:hypothetical protein
MPESSGSIQLIHLKLFYGISADEVESAIPEYRASASKLTRRLVWLWARNRSLAALYMAVFLLLCLSPGMMLVSMFGIDRTSLLSWILIGGLAGLVIYLVAPHAGINGLAERLMAEEDETRKARKQCKDALHAMLRYLISRDQVT